MQRTRVWILSLTPSSQDWGRPVRMLACAYVYSRAITCVRVRSRPSRHRELCAEIRRCACVGASACACPSCVLERHFAFSGFVTPA
eukprot:5597091-Pleurochrysis_carterae.AAC.4